MGKGIELHDLTEQNFAKFGKIISSKSKTPDCVEQDFNWYEKLGYFEDTKNISLNILKARKRQFEVNCLEYHNETEEAIIPMEGNKVILVVAPAGEFNKDDIKAFSVNRGEGVMLNKGVRHIIPYPIEADTDCLIVFKHATGVNDMHMDNFEAIKIEKL